MIESFELSNHKFNWGELYYGLKKGFIDIQAILKFYNENKILFFTQERYIEILLGFEDSSFEVIRIIKKYIYQDDLVDIQHNENDIIEVIDFTYVPEKYKEFWDDWHEYSILNNIIVSNESVLEKFYKLFLNHSDVNYKEEWRKFISFYFNGHTSLNENELYLELLNYFQAVKAKLNI